MSNKILCALGATMLLGACSSSNVKTQIQENAETRPAAVVTSQPSCKVATTILDSRSADEIVSGVGSTKVTPASIVEWVETGLSVHQTPNYQLSWKPLADEQPFTGQQLKMQLKLRKMYLLSQNTSKSTTIVLSAELFDAQGKSLGQTTSRGADTSVNWVNASGEAYAAFERSLDQALTGLDGFIAKHCYNT